MGRRGRIKQERLAEKLLQIRLTLGLSQTELLYRLEAADLIVYNQISRYETGTHEPPLRILLAYARLAGVYVDVLIDDELDLPDKLPGTINHNEIRRKFASRRKRAGKTKRR
jgi:transcriptional regulator with XRE-family HTH domain